MAALTLGTTTLRTLISSPTLSLDHIEETSTALSEALADAEDINVAIREANVALPSEQEDEVEMELKELIKESEMAEQKEEEMKKLEKQTAEEERQPKVAEDEARSKLALATNSKQDELDSGERASTEAKLSALEGLPAAVSSGLSGEQDVIKVAELV